MAIEVMLMDNVKKLGKAGEIVKVAPGYARNYLFTKGLAAVATEAAKRRLKKLDKLALTVSAATTDGKKLYGSVSITDLLAAIEAQRGVKIERGQFSLEDSLREVGEYDATINLGHGVEAKCKITILDEQAAAAE